MIICAQGWSCPKPIIETKKLLDTLPEVSVTTIVDNKIAVDNLLSFAKSSNYNSNFDKKGELFYVNIEKIDSITNNTTKIDMISSIVTDSFVIQISSNKYGCGDVELGESLMKAYLYALTESSVLPSSLLFINSGVFLTTEGSPVLDSLEALSKAGTEILSCGACLNFYNLSEKLIIGKITNMYTIVEKLVKAKKAFKI